MCIVGHGGCMVSVQTQDEDEPEADQIHEEEYDSFDDYLEVTSSFSYLEYSSGDVHGIDWLEVSFQGG